MKQDSSFAKLTRSFATSAIAFILSYKMDKYSPIDTGKCFVSSHYSLTKSSGPRTCLPNNNSKGEKPVASCVSSQHANRRAGRRKSHSFRPLPDLRIIAINVLCQRSNMPLVSGWYGDAKICVIPRCLVTSFISCDVKLYPLSDLR